MNFSDQHALVTGASSGIGLAIARALHTRGCAVTLVARRAEHLSRITEELNRIRPQSARFMVCDLALPSSVTELESHIRTSRIDILVNNAGVGSFGPFETLDLQRELAMVAINLVAPMRLCHAVIPQMKERRAGSIIHISSVAGFQPLPYMATYASTKAFNYTHSLSLRYELAEYGIRVLTVCPGPTETEFGGVARVPGTPTGTPRESVETVARATLRALERNNAIVVPGVRSALLSIPCRVLPKALTTWLTGRMLRSVLPR